ncbi:hypothetical protein BDN72DRAFT_844767 [Pluteus cervinus]|uniref:Uncharacterized protein n=1 Tax=Pluteus cervinus TaxID=181527 RepID=A0ACD3AKB1_9AGAR|nr:hypothetical protein BDN72DRAFT_844767 [Pluteus cervinus]
MPILRIAPGRNLEAFPGLSVIDDQTSPKTHLAWIRSIEAGLKNWEERVKQSRSPVTSLPKIIFIATEKISKLSIEPLEETYDQSQVDSQYPAHYRIPPTTLSDKLSSTDRVTRAVRFALASLLFTMTIRTPPFEDLSDEAVQEEYEQGRYPEVVTALSDPVLVRLLRYWSWEFEEAWVPTIPPESESFSVISSLRH